MYKLLYAAINWLICLPSNDIGQQVGRKNDVVADMDFYGKRNVI